MEHSQTRDREAAESREREHTTLEATTETVTVTKEKWKKFADTVQTLTRKQEKM